MQALGELGWVEGQNLVLELRHPGRGEHERLAELGAELVRLKVLPPIPPGGRGRTATK